MTAPPPEALREALADWLYALDECPRNEGLAKFLERTGGFVSRFAGSEHSCVLHKPMHCFRCTCNDYLVRADLLLTGPLAPILAEHATLTANLATMRAERDEAQAEAAHGLEHRNQLMDRVVDLRTEAAAARSHEAAARAECDALKAEIATWRTAQHEAWQRIIRYPSPQVCKHLVVADLLGGLEAADLIRTPAWLAEAVVNADDELALTADCAALAPEAQDQEVDQ